MIRTSVAVAAISLMLVSGASAWNDILNSVWGPKGNDTGGIIAYSLTYQGDIRQLAIAHCAYYGKVVKFLSVDAQEGGYISFACRWVPYGATDATITTLY